MATREYIALIESIFANEGRWIEIPCDKPVSLRKRIYKKSRALGYVWGFATTEKSVFVIL
jgi:hypothetical protein